MNGAAWLPQIIISMLVLLSGAALGGVFVRRGTFKGTYDLLLQSVDRFSAVQSMYEHQIKQLTTERDDAINERDAERTRSARLDRALTDCQLEKADLQRENARLRAGPQP